MQWATPGSCETYVWKPHASTACWRKACPHLRYWQVQDRRHHYYGLSKLTSLKVAAAMSGVDTVRCPLPNIAAATFGLVSCDM